MTKATIKSKSGATITVEGTEREVANVVGMFERTTVVGHAKEAIARARATKKGYKKRSAASDLIMELKESGLFRKPRSLTEIAKALEEAGHIYPVTTLSGVMLSLVQKKLIGRKKQKGKWVYGN